MEVGHSEVALQVGEVGRMLGMEKPSEKEAWRESDQIRRRRK